MPHIELKEKLNFIALSHSTPKFFPALLESQSFHSKIGRYSILFAAPSETIQAYDAISLNKLLKAVDIVPQKKKNILPFDFGWFVYLSYESVIILEDKFADMAQKNGEPLAVAIHCNGCIIHDHVTHKTTLSAKNVKAQQQILAKLKTVQTLPNIKIDICDEHVEDAAIFLDQVEKAKKYIKEGAIYQANLSRKWTYKTCQKVSAVLLYDSLSKTNPAPFAGILQLDDFAIVSSSPERLVKIEKNTVETRPIAGTRPRSTNRLKDQELMRELINTPKERAEHIMLIDLERNDIGKVCETGSVEVDELMEIESYQHVHHIVSNVKGRLKDGLSVIDVIKSLFPGGTITGCPKIHCMELINQIENRPRGCYTGSFGYINSLGNMDFNILIRTMSVKNKTIEFLAGAGIVYDSVAEQELKETEHKAQGLINAL